MLTVAYRRLGATSSAVISILERRSPSWFSQLRWSRRPVTMTRLPRPRDWATFSASWPQQTMSKNDVASSHSWLWRFCQRRLTATPKVVVAWPDGVNRSSGSRVRLPMTLTWLPLDMVGYAPVALLSADAH